MNKKGETNTWVSFSFLIISVVFIIAFVIFIRRQMNGAAVWEDYYAKEIVKVINLAKPGDIVELNVHQGTVSAKKNNVNTYGDLFRIDNTHKEVCVRFTNSARTCYSYFNDVYIDNWELKLGVPGNVLYFEVKDKGGGNE